MSPSGLAVNANFALYASMIVYTLAMLAFAWHLATRGGATEEQASTSEHELSPDDLVRTPAQAGAASSSPLNTGGHAAVATVEAVATLAASPGSPASEPGPVLAPTRDMPGLTEAVPASGTPSRASRQRGNIALMLTYLATALLSAAVLMRGLAVGRPPWGDMFEFATAAAAAVGAVFSLLARRNGWQWLGLFIVSPILLVLGVSVTVLYTEAGELMPALKSYWLGIHVSIAFLAVAFFTLGFALGVLSLARSRKTGSGDSAGIGARGRYARLLTTLPSGADLERSAYSMNMIGFILWTFTLIAGAIWAKGAWGAYWQWDPKEVWTFIIWVVYAAYMHGRATAGVNRRRTSTIAMAGYVAVLVNFTLVNLMATFAGMHNYSGM